MQKQNQIILFLIVCITYPLTAQDYTWWANKHNWDGHTYWREYLKFASAYFGPNALPIPQMHTSQLPSVIELECSNNYYYGYGDETRDISARILLPILPGRVAIEIWDVAYEQFSTTEQVRDRRFSRGFSGKGSATGDVNIAMLFQLVRGQSFPDVLFNINFRTASGSNIDNVRYTDSPGYNFDLTLSKSFFSANNECRVSTVGGLYIWQRFYKDNWQNDAFLYGLAITEKYKKHLIVESQLTGYSGYTIGDKPLVWRFSCGYTNNKKHYFAQYEHGIRDFPFNHFKLGLIYRPGTLISKEKLKQLIDNE